MYALSAYMSVHHVHHVLAGCLWKPEEGMSSARTGFKELTKGCLESNPGPLEKQPVLLISEHHSSPLTVFLGKEQR